MDYFIGIIALFPYNFVPVGWYLCNGQIIQIAENNVLYSLIGTNYGGNGSSTFALPNMQGLEPTPGMNYYICYEGVYPERY